MSREEIEEMVASINRSNTWTLWPRMSRDRWYSLGAMAGYLASTALLPRHVGRVAALGVLFASIPLCMIWMAESELVAAEARLWLRRVGWTFMAVPAVTAMLAGI
jgi:hypothetical protein